MINTQVEELENNLKSKLISESIGGDYEDFVNIKYNFTPNNKNNVEICQSTGIETFHPNQKENLKINNEGEKSNLSLFTARKAINEKSSKKITSFYLSTNNKDCITEKKKNDFFKESQNELKNKFHENFNGIDKQRKNLASDVLNKITIYSNLKKNIGKNNKSKDSEENSYNKENNNESFLEGDCKIKLHEKLSGQGISEDSQQVENAKDLNFQFSEDEEEFNEEVSYQEKSDIFYSSNVENINSEKKKSTRDKKSKTKNKKKLKEKMMENIKKFFGETQVNKELPKGVKNLNLTDQILELEQETSEIPAFTGLKRLRKKAEIIREENEIKKITSSLFENEAELGSDNEDHDDVIKRIDDEEKDENSDLDKDLKELINDEEVENEYSDNLKEKFFDDMIKKDREEIKKVIKGPEERRKQLQRKEFVDGEYLPLTERIKKYKNENEGDADLFFSDLLFKKNKTFLNENDEDHLVNSTLIGHEEDDELKMMLEQHQNNKVKRFSDQSKFYNKILLKRKKENDKILENVIDLSTNSNTLTSGNSNMSSMTGFRENSKDDKNMFFQKGNIPTDNSNSLTMRMKMAQKSNSLICKFGNIFDPKNSFLHAMKNDKYYVKSEVEDLKFDETSKMKNNKEKILSGFSSAIGNSKLSKTQAKATNLSALFKSNLPPKTSVIDNKKPEEINLNNESKNLLKKFNN